MGQILHALATTTPRIRETGGVYKTFRENVFSRKQNSSEAASAS